MLYLVAAMRPTPKQWGDMGVIYLTQSGWYETRTGGTGNVAKAMQSYGGSMRLRILLSYWYYKDTDLDALFAKYFGQPYPDVFADSGAFSAHSLGGSVSVEAYSEWVQKYCHLFTTYANLDVKGDVDAGLRNLKYMEDRGLKPLPVYHGGEPWSVLADFIQSYAYIGLGGLTGHTRSGSDEMYRMIVRCFQMAGDKAVYHGFGTTNWNILKSFRWYSADSSSWGAGFRYGGVPLFDARAGRFVKISLGDRASCLRYAGLIRQFGFDPMDFADRARNDRAKICAISALSYIHAEGWLRKRHGEVYIPQREGEPGVRVHLADANPTRYEEAVRGGKVYLADTGGVDQNYARAAAGVKSYLVESLGDGGKDLERLGQVGQKVYLAEHSLDRGGVGDTSRVVEVLKRRG